MKSDQKWTRRKFLGTTAGAAAATTAAGAAGALELTTLGQGGGNANSSQDLVLTNGRIHTMDARNSIVRNVTIRNGRFVTVSDAAPARLPGARVIDLKGRTVVPGIVEGHIHSVSL